MIFVRFAGCNLDCAYCDTRRAAVSRGVLERLPGSGVIEYVDSEFSASRLAAVVKSLPTPASPCHAVSLTGGEPLMAGAAFINAFARTVRESGVPIHLETNGTLPDVLSEVIDCVDYTSMDIKVESATGQPPRYEENRRFLCACARKECCVKVVFVPETRREEIARAADVVAGVDPSIPFILQPATPAGRVKHRPAPALMFSLYDVASGRLKDVRVIPQTHRLLHVR
jgi:organic radical activating enzyme